MMLIRACNELADKIGSFWFNSWTPMSDDMALLLPRVCYFFQFDVAL